MQARFGQPHRGHRAGPGQFILEHRHLRDDHIGAGGHAGRESVAHHPPGISRAAHGIGSRPHHGLARVQVEQALSHIGADYGIKLGQSFARGDGHRGDLCDLRLGAAKVEEGPVDVHRQVPRLLPLALAGENSLVRV